MRSLASLALLPLLTSATIPSTPDLGKTEFPEPWFDNTWTQQALDYHPMTLHEGLEVNVKWLRDKGYI